MKFLLINLGRSSEEETLNMKIKDGDPKDLRVIAYVNETKCEVTPQSLNFGCLAVAQKSSINLFLKNTNPKYSAIFQVDTASLPPNLEVKPIKGRVLPDACQRPVRFCCQGDFTGTTFGHGGRHLCLVLKPFSILRIDSDAPAVGEQTAQNTLLKSL